MSSSLVAVEHDTQCLSTIGDAQSGETHEQRVARLFRERNRSLVRFLEGRLHSREEAQEVAQEAYLQLLGLDCPEGIHFLQGYLYRTAANIATNRIKQRIQRRRNDERMFFETEDERSPERLWAADADVASLIQALYELPVNCREAFQLVRLNGLSSEEAGRELNLHPRSVRRYVARALAHCMAVMESAEPRKEPPHAPRCT